MSLKKQSQQFNPSLHDFKDEVPASALAKMEYPGTGFHPPAGNNNNKAQNT